MESITLTTPRDASYLDDGADGPRWRISGWHPQGAFERRFSAGEDVMLGRLTRSRGADWQLPDPRLSRQHCRVVCTAEHLLIYDLQSRNGTWLNGRRTADAVCGDQAVVRVGDTVMVVERLAHADPTFAFATAEVPGRSTAARRVRSEIALAAESGLPVLIQGETGTGKEFVAAALHRHHQALKALGHRVIADISDPMPSPLRAPEASGGASGVAAEEPRRGDLVRFNVVAIPEHLFESELFGHVKGAFTGAVVARPGRLQEANGGTLLLDEIGELPLSMQAKLLRALEEKVVRPVGASSDVPTHVRFVAATNADLDALIATGRFRHDLAARLRGATIHLPPLRERRADLLDLADAVQPGPLPWLERLTADAMEILLLHTWPDNLRELRAVLARVEALAGPTLGGLAHLPPGLVARVTAAVRAGDAAAPAPTATGALVPAPRRRPTVDELRTLLRRHNGNCGAIATATGVHRRQVYRWLSYADIDSDELDSYRK